MQYPYLVPCSKRFHSKNSKKYKITAFRIVMLLHSSGLKYQKASEYLDLNETDVFTKIIVDEF